MGKQSKLFGVNWADFGKGCIVAVVTAVISFLYQLTLVGPLVLNLALLQAIGSAAAAALLAYLLKNLFTNSQNKLLTAESK